MSQPKPEIATPAAALTPAALKRERKRGDADAKHSTMIEMITRAEGATKEELAAATGWLPHTAGARMSGIKDAYHITRKRETGRGTVYRANPK